MITGGAGFVGSQIGLHLRNSGHTVTLLDNMSYGKKDNLEVDSKKVYDKFILDDIRNTTFEEHCKGIDVVIHLAGIAPLPECQSAPIKAYDNNLLGTLNVLESCRKVGVKKIIFSSTSAVYENCEIYPLTEDKMEKEPDLIYSMSKRACELACQSYTQNYKMDITVLRFFNVYGPHQDFMRKQPPLMGYITKCLLGNMTPTFYSDGNQKRDYVYIEDIFRMVDLILDSSNSGGEIFNVCTNKAYSVKEIYDLYQKKFGIYREPVFEPSANFWDRYPELFEGTYPLSKKRLIKEVDKYSLGSYNKVKDILGWEPKISLEDGIEKCIAYAKKKQVSSGG